MPAPAWPWAGGHHGPEPSAALDECERVQPDVVDKWALWQEYRNPADREQLFLGPRKLALPE